MPAPLVDGDTVAVDGQVARVRVSSRRRRIGLTVERDSTLTLAVPEGCPAYRAQEFLRANRSWVIQKLQLRQETLPTYQVKHFTSGEGFRYLGRLLPLLLVDDPDASPRVLAGRMQIDRSIAEDPTRARHELIAWYRRTGKKWAQDRLQPWAARLGVSEPTVAVRELGWKWGSYSPVCVNDPQRGRINLNWLTFQVPAPLVEYVIAHEMAHAIIPDHSRRFWNTLRSTMPDCDTRRELLDDFGRRVWRGEIVNAS
ncbi:SprT family zinc-dependent metalloprotease [Nocardiopsis rhodophaea]|uniref:SprT family zinc-dependent metalloprotease n=2 Tax=Nocardiopsis rhodophaea TaxID=280238 RepID=A0ABN2SZN3_9ACTN